MDFDEAIKLFKEMKQFSQLKLNGNEENEDTIFNFSPDITNEEKCKKLRQEYTRWNRQTNNSNEKIKNQAKKMVGLTANLRKKYNC